MAKKSSVAKGVVARVWTIIGGRRKLLCNVYTIGQIVKPVEYIAIGERGNRLVESLPLSWQISGVTSRLIQPATEGLLGPLVVTIKTRHGIARGKVFWQSSDIRERSLSSCLPPFLTNRRSKGHTFVCFQGSGPLTGPVKSLIALGFPRK